MRYSTPPNLQLQIAQEKQQLISELMERNNFASWIIFVRETSVNPDPILELVAAGDIVWESAFIFLKTEEGVHKTALVGNYDAEAEKKKGLWDEVIGYKEGISEHLLEIIDKANPETIAINYSLDDVIADGISHGMFLKLSNILLRYVERFVSAAPMIRSLRGIKTPTEVELITKACELTEEINTRVTQMLSLGMTELEIQKLYYEEMNKEGVKEAWQRVSCPSINAGPEKELGHLGPSEFKIKKGHTLHNDFGVKLNGYCSDIQRMWFFGKEEEVPEELMHAYETVHEAITKAAEYIKPGLTGFSVDKIARDHVISRGYQEYGHALGHQLGTEAHDGGVLLGPLWERYGDIPKGEIEEGNVFTLELHVNTKNYGTVSLEEDIVITKEGCRFLVQRQEKLIFVTI